MRLSQLQYGAFLSYCPRGDSREIRHSKNVMLALKNDKFVGTPPILISQYVAQTIQRKRTTLKFPGTALPFDSFFQPDTILVPTPRSSRMRPDTLWVPHRIATALVRVGLGKEVVPYLKRVEPVRKAHLSASEDRPRAAEHYESMMVQSGLTEPDEIVLVDDIVTRGATLLGAANRLASAFPKTRIRAFAVMRTISNPDEFKGLNDPCVGTITLQPSGGTLRRP
jgi:phosphoribosylpyrophosphate synthetase